MVTKLKILLRAGLGLLGLVWALGLPAHAGNPPIQAPSASSGKTVQTARLGKINVTAMKKLVQTLQQVKVALNTPFTDSAKDVNQMVCLLHTGMHGMRVMGDATLECGTQGWFSMRRSGTQLGLGPQLGGMSEETDAAPTLGHPWHSIRLINYRQLMVLRALLKQLPAPGKGTVMVVDKGGKPVLTVKH